MSIISRAEMKRLAKKTITNSMISIYNGKYCKNKVMTLDFRNYANGGFHSRLDMNGYNVIINIFQNGEVTYQQRNYISQEPKIKILDKSLEYEEDTVNAVLKNMIKDIKLRIKHLNKDF